MFRYLIIESKKDIANDESLILSIFSEFLSISKIDRNPFSIYLFFNHQTDVSFLDLVLNLTSDSLTDFRIFVSSSFEKEEDMIMNLNYVKEKIVNIPFYKYPLIDEKVLLNHFIHQIDNSLKKAILKKYEKDQVMLETIRVYLESNQNMSLASKKLYLHRNTIIQRIDKFHQLTGFDVRVFNDAFLIYHLVK
jgi:DNA-binding PucR family transcriptional regulator